MGSVGNTRNPTPPTHTRKGKEGKEAPTGEKEQQGRGGANRGSTAARPTLTRDWGGPQVRDPVPSLFKRETEHLYLRQPIHGIGTDPG